ncbi:MAG: hypothetical protein AAFV33_12825 [Chloroflexota bacterium]
MMTMTYYREPDGVGAVAVFEGNTQTFLVLYGRSRARKVVYQEHRFASRVAAQTYMEHRYGVPLDVWIDMPFIDFEVSAPEQFWDRAKRVAVALYATLLIGPDATSLVAKSAAGRKLMNAMLRRIRGGLPVDYVDWLFVAHCRKHYHGGEM